MTRDDGIAKLITVRHYCFVRGVLGSRSNKRGEDQPAEEDFRQAFRTMNRLYAQLRDNIAPEVVPKRTRRLRTAA
jgi:hypothetical protein